MEARAMRTQRRRDLVQVVAIFVAFSALGLGTRLLVVVSERADPPSGMCRLVTDFWNGDQLLC